MNQNQFYALTSGEIAQIMQEHGRKVVAFPFNGTRRWFQLEKMEPGQDFQTAYHEAITTRQVEICKLLFEHGVETVLMPLLSPYLFDSRGEAYTQTAVEALTYLTDNPKFHTLYETFDVKVRFYGEYEAYLKTPQFQPVLQRLNQLTEQTAHHKKHRLYWGICAHDSTQTVSKLTIDYFKIHGTYPSRESLIEMYYGEQIDAVHIFITASKMRVFDLPMLANGREDLYFTIAPSPYFSQAQLRSILFDHLFARAKQSYSYEMMSSTDWAELQKFYHANLEHTFGVGTRIKQWGIWLPQLQNSQQEEPTHVK